MGGEIFREMGIWSGGKHLFKAYGGGSPYGGGKHISHVKGGEILNFFSIIIFFINLSLILYIKFGVLIYIFLILLLMVHFGKYNLTKIYNSFFPTFVLYNSLFQHSARYGGGKRFSYRRRGGNSIWGGKALWRGGKGPRRTLCIYTTNFIKVQPF